MSIPMAQGDPCYLIRPCFIKKNKIIVLIVCVSDNICDNIADQKGVRVIWQIHMDICQQQAYLHLVQIWTQDSSEDIKIRDYKQRHG